MKYFIIAGEASGDMHAANLMKALQRQDSAAEFMYMGGVAMRAVGGDCIMPCEKVAVMGFKDVVRNLSVIRTAAQRVQESLISFVPDIVICVDYAGFNFRYILPFVTKKLPSARIVYYIPPKVWAWKRHRIKTLKKHCHLVLTIFPFEQEYLREAELTQAYYVGNPTLDAITAYETLSAQRSQGDYIALVPGSRRSEINSNLPLMLRVASRFDREIIIAAAPGIELEFYAPIVQGYNATLKQGATYNVMSGAQAALVTSGTATLEAALLKVPQVVCYAIKGGRLANLVFKHLFTIPFISLVNLVAAKEVVQELFGANFTPNKVSKALAVLLEPNIFRSKMITEYQEIRTRLTPPVISRQHTAADNAAHLIVRGC